MSHPLLTKLLADQLYHQYTSSAATAAELADHRLVGGHSLHHIQILRKECSIKDAKMLIDGLPSWIADTLERALDCQFEGCGLSVASLAHGFDDRCDHDPFPTCHPYVPLVTP